MTVTCLLTTLTLAEDLPLQLSLKPKVLIFYTIFSEEWQEILETKLPKQNIQNKVMVGLSNLYNMLQENKFYVKSDQVCKSCMLFFYLALTIYLVLTFFNTKYIYSTIKKIIVDFIKMTHSESLHIYKGNKNSYGTSR